MEKFDKTARFFAILMIKGLLVFGAFRIHAVLGFIAVISCLTDDLVGTWIVFIVSPFTLAKKVIKYAKDRNESKKAQIKMVRDMLFTACVYLGVDRRTVDEIMDFSLRDDPDEMLALMNKMKYTPVAYAYFIIVLFSRSELRHGNKTHIHRGVLSARGKHLLNVHDVATDILIHTGYFGKKYGQAEKETVREAIQKAG